MENPHGSNTILGEENEPRGANWADPDLQTLVDLFYDDPSELGSFTPIAASDIPEPCHSLLAHTHHMTVAMERYHQCRIDVRVLEKQGTATHYSRQIVLTRHSDGRIVQFGIVRLALSNLGAEIRQEIEGESAPLGRILIEHNVLRNVKLMTFWRIQPGAKLRAIFQRGDLTSCYGRTALIYTNGIPAVELLEVVPAG